MELASIYFRILNILLAPVFLIGFSAAIFSSVDHSEIIRAKLAGDIGQPVNKSMEQNG
ncbi:MAG: hypothetical protein K9H14_07350 [Actinomycetia bacterium]|nr:hypothetical protein [Actinomycetes bacterium]